MNFKSHRVVNDNKKVKDSGENNSINTGLNLKISFFGKKKESCKNKWNVIIYIGAMFFQGTFVDFWYFRDFHRFFIIFQEIISTYDDPCP